MLVTAAERATLGVAAGTPGTDTTGPLQGKVCTWMSTSMHPDQAYSGAAAIHQGAEFALGAEPLRTVGGFAATTTISTGSDPNYFCGLLVDVAPGQSLSAVYSNSSEDYPGMNRQVACGKAQQLAAAMLATLRAQQGR